MKKNDEILRSFGARIRGLRRTTGLSQEAFAARAGLDRSYMGAVERGERNLTLLNLFRIARALGVPPSTLLEGLRP